MKLVSSLYLLVIYLLIGKGGGDETSTRVVERWQELQKEMLVLSGRMSKVSQSVTRNIYRREDDLRKELEQAVKDVKTIGQELTGKGVKEWTCVTSTGEIELGMKSWNSLHVCLHSLADKLSTTEGRLSSLTGRLRALALPCHMDIPCSTHTKPTKNNKNNININPRDNITSKNNNGNTENAKNPTQNNSTFKNENASQCMKYPCEENNRIVDPNMKEIISPYDQHYKLEPSSTKENCIGKGCTKIKNRQHMTKEERYGCCSPVKALYEMEEVGKKGRILAKKMDALGNSTENEIETCLKQVKQEIIKLALIKKHLSRCNN